ncbi:GtrA family protein [Subtercola endophyticus]|uniref:GtrA family protein n=1 Tax=Subtercola endophyticus TaxID=2895559 RepID=UPI001E2CEABB|nr:GtrA family protein [Subtercola endophyticus]UFS57886.1 GtrA family protein [Subtercola endophyticus]
MKTSALYVLFAAISTAANLGSQALVSILGTGVFGAGAGVMTNAVLVASVLIGTGVGVVAKYILDKRFIFRYEVKSMKHQARTLGLYTIMSGITTLIFWGFEFGAYFAFGTAAAKYTGAVIGLAIGYVIKYFLDKNITFREDKSGVNTL